MLFAFKVSAQLPKVAYIYAEPDASQAHENIAADLFATGLFETVDTYNASVQIGDQPSLAQIMTYDAVLVQGNASFLNAVTLGDDMAAFAASGGGVILSAYSLVNYNTYIKSMLLGEWQNGGDWHIVYNQVLEFEFIDCGDGIGTIYEPDHPVAAHANELEFTDYLGGAFPINPQVTDDAIRIFDFVDGNPLAYASETLPNRLDLGIFMAKPEGCSYLGVYNVSNFLADAFYYVIGELVSVNNTTITGFTFYPNPVNEKINLSSVEKIENVEIYTVSGKKVFEQSNLSTTTTQLDISSFVSGIYIMKIIVNGQIGTYRIIKN